jgi:hypothetical protein
MRGLLLYLFIIIGLNLQIDLGLPSERTSNSKGLYLFTVENISSLQCSWFMT